MPHLIIEFARDLVDDSRVPAMLDAVHAAALSTGLFEEQHIRVRALPVSWYRTGSGGPYIHAQLRLHGGRTVSEKQAFSGAVLAAIRAQGWPARSVTVEVVDMDRDTYAKHSS